MTSFSRNYAMKIELSKDQIEEIIACIRCSDCEYCEDNSDIIEILQLALKNEN